MSVIRNVASIAAAAIVVVGFAANANAYVCKAKSEAAVGPGVNQGTALATSRALWTASVKQKFGLEWSVWSIAKSPTQSCAPAGSGYQCVVTAKPCQYVVP